MLAFFPRSQATAIKVFSIAVAAVTLALTIAIFSLYDYKDGGFQFINSYRWLEEPLNIDFSLGIDGISAPMVLLTGIVMLAGVLVTWNLEHRTKEFFVLFMFLVSGVFGVFVVRDLFFLFFFYELAVLPMFPLIGIWGSSTDFGAFLRTKEYGAMKLTLYLVAGSVLVWVAIIAVYVAASDFGAPTFSLETLDAISREGAFSQNFQLLFFPFFMVGFGVLAGLWPLHTWSPDGHVAAPTAVSMIHAGVLMKLGGLRHYPRWNGPAAQWRRGLDAGAHRPGHRERPLRRRLRHVPTGPQVRGGLLQHKPHGPGAHGHSHAASPGDRRGGAADVLPRRYDGPFLCRGGVHLRQNSRSRHHRPGRPGQTNGRNGGLLRRGRPGLPWPFPASAALWPSSWSSLECSRSICPWAFWQS